MTLSLEVWYVSFIIFSFSIQTGYILILKSFLAKSKASLIE